MPNVKVSTAQEVLEKFRQDVVATLQSRKIKVPSEALETGACDHALAAWVRLHARTVPVTPRAVHESPELLARNLDATTRAAVAAIRSEFERGDDMTRSDSRGGSDKAGFNDFLFNKFGIHHMHLGAPGAGRDITKAHAMAAAEADGALLFVIVSPQDAYFLDVLNPHCFRECQENEIACPDHSRRTGESCWSVTSSMVFSRARRSKPPSKGLGLALQLCSRSTACATRAATYWMVKVRKVKGADGLVSYQRSACTSTQVASATDRILNMIVDLVNGVAHEADMLAEYAEKVMGTRPSEFKLEVVSTGRVVVLRELNTGLSSSRTTATKGSSISTSPLRADRMYAEKPPTGEGRRASFC